VAGERTHFVDATRLASGLLGDAIATNLFMVGFAYQKGLLPLSVVNLFLYIFVIAALDGSL